MIIVILGFYLLLLYVLLFTFLSAFDYIIKKTYQLSDSLKGSCFGSILVGSTIFTFCALWLYT